MSLRSGAGIVAALQGSGLDVQGFDVSPGPELLKLDWKRPPDLVYLALHGSFGEDGTIQGFLESLNIPYTGSGVFSSSLCFHKALTKKQVSNVGVPIPFSYDVVGLQSVKKLFQDPETQRIIRSGDWFIKAARQGSTIGIERYEGSKTPEKEASQAFFSKVENCLKFDQHLLIEEWVRGPELTVAVVNGKALPAVEIRPQSQFYDFESKYTKGKTEYLCPAPISKEHSEQVAQYAEAAFRALDCRDYARADFILGPRGPVFLEMNTLPGMTETSLVPKAAAASGLSYSEFILKIIHERANSK